MIYLMLYVIIAFVAWPIMARWYYLADQGPSWSACNRQDSLVAAIATGFLSATLWPVYLPAAWFVTRR